MMKQPQLLLHQVAFISNHLKAKNDDRAFVSHRIANFYCYPTARRQNRKRVHLCREAVQLWFSLYRRTFHQVGGIVNNQLRALLTQLFITKLNLHMQASGPFPHSVFMRALASNDQRGQMLCQSENQRVTSVSCIFVVLLRGICCVG